MFAMGRPSLKEVWAGRRPKTRELPIKVSHLPNGTWIVPDYEHPQDVGYGASTAQDASDTAETRGSQGYGAGSGVGG